MTVHKIGWNYALKHKRTKKAAYVQDIIFAVFFFNVVLSLFENSKTKSWEKLVPVEGNPEYSSVLLPCSCTMCFFFYSSIHFRLMIFHCDRFGEDAIFWVWLQCLRLFLHLLCCAIRWGEAEFQLLLAISCFYSFSTKCCVHIASWKSAKDLSCSPRQRPTCPWMKLTTVNK